MQRNHRMTRLFIVGTALLSLLIVTLSTRSILAARAQGVPSLAPPSSHQRSVPSILGKFTSYNIPTPNSEPRDITLGPDGNYWFTEYFVGKIGRITPNGTITEYPIPYGDMPGNITAGPDDNLWFTDWSRNSLGQITPNGTITMFPLPSNYDSGLSDITTGPDGNLWFTQESTNQIGMMTPQGTVTEYTIPTANSNPWNIVTGSDGKLWFTESGSNKIGKITTAGVFTEFPIPISGEPLGISAGPKGNNALWFTDRNAYRIGKITLQGKITLFPMPIQGSPYDITASNGYLWYTDSGLIGRVSTGGKFLEFPIQSPGASPYGITHGAGGFLWFVDMNGKVWNMASR